MSGEHEEGVKPDCLNALTEAERDLESAERRLEAVRTLLCATSAELNRVEAYVCRMGSAPRYRVAYDARLREAEAADTAAADAVSEAEFELNTARARVAICAVLRNP